MSIAAHIVSQGIHPIATVEAILRNDTLKTDEDYTLVPGTHLSWETRMSPEYVCVPVFFYNVLISGDIHSNMSFVWGLSVSEIQTVPHEAIGMIKEWFRDLMYNSPLVDSALRIRVSQIQMIVAAGAHHFRRVCTTLSERNKAIKESITGPWAVVMGTPFMNMMRECMAMAPIPCEIVALTRGCEPDVIVEQHVGIVFASPEDVADRVVLLFLLIFSKRYNLLGHKRAGNTDTFGIPTQINRFLDLLVNESKAPFYHNVKRGAFSSGH